MSDNNELLHAMIAYDRGDPKRIHHFLKVYEFAKLICAGEKVGDELRHITETAAIVHDIGIHLAEQKYGNGHGHYQEIEGPPEAKKMLEALGYDTAVTERVCRLVSLHHTYTNIDGIDYQILVEADFLVNIYEHHENDSDGEAMRAEARAVRKTIFRTETGKELLDELYG